MHDRSLGSHNFFNLRILADILGMVQYYRQINLYLVPYKVLQSHSKVFEIGIVEVGIPIEVWHTTRVMGLFSWKWVSYRFDK